MHQCKIRSFLFGKRVFQVTHHLGYSKYTFSFRKKHATKQVCISAKDTIIRKLSCLKNEGMVFVESLVRFSLQLFTLNTECPSILWPKIALVFLLRIHPFLLEHVQHSSYVEFISSYYRQGP